MQSTPKGHKAPPRGRTGAAQTTRMKMSIGWIRPLVAGLLLFGVPGAFTPTCSAKHLPGFVQHADALKAKGVDTIACLSVNDPFVMGAWGADQNVGDAVTMLADGSANFTKAAGLELDLTDRGLGLRCQRFAMIVEDGTVKSIHIDEGTFEKTSAETMLGEL